MTWLIYALGSVFLFTVLVILQKKVSVESQYPRAMSVLFSSSGALFALCIFLASHSAQRITFPSHPQAYFFLAGTIIFYGLYERGRFFVVKTLDASVFALISIFSVLVTFFSSVFLFHESLTPAKLFGAFLVIGALAFVSYEKKQVQINPKYLAIGFLICTFLGLAWTTDKGSTQYFDLTLYNVLAWSLPILIIAFPKVRLAELRAEAKNGSWLILLMAGINMLGYLCQLQALALAPATMVMPVIQMSVLTTVLASIVFLHEKHSVWRKILGGVVGLVGVVLLVR